MSSITVRNLDETIKERLAQRARASGDSLEALVRKILSREAGVSNKERFADLIRRLAKESAALPASDPEGFDFDRLYLRARSLSRPPLEFDWWPDQEDTEGGAPSE